VTELLGRDLPVMLVAQVARVAVRVTAALGERHDVVDDGRLACALLGRAHLTQAIGALQPAQPLRLTGATAEAFDPRR